MFEDLADRHLTKERKPASYLVAVIGHKERRPFAMYMRVRILRPYRIVCAVSLTILRALSSTVSTDRLYIAVDLSLKKRMPRSTKASDLRIAWVQRLERNCKAG